MFTAFTPRQMFRAAVDLELQWARALQASASCDERSLEWAEHANRLHVFSLFQNADASLTGVRNGDLRSMIESTSSADPYDRVWIIEGIGYLWSNRVQEPVPSSTLIPLHSGIGLAVAQRRLKDRAGQAVRNLLPQLVDLCAGSALQGFEYVAIEAMGLAVRNLHPQLAPAIDAMLVASDPVLRACFWHGMGRGTYFATSRWTAVEGTTSPFGALGETGPDGVARANAAAGFAWAATLVNLQTPAVLGRYVKPLDRECDRAAFADGIRSALIVWQDAARDDSSIASLIEFDLIEACGARGARLIYTAAEEAIRLYPTLSRNGHLQHVFHCEAA